jgi:hypothetical protein
MKFFKALCKSEWGNSFSILESDIDSYFEGFFCDSKENNVLNIYQKVLTPLKSIIHTLAYNPICSVTIFRSRRFHSLLVLK